MFEYDRKNWGKNGQWNKYCTFFFVMYISKCDSYFSAGHNLLFQLWTTGEKILCIDQYRSAMKPFHGILELQVSALFNFNIWNAFFSPLQFFWLVLSSESVDYEDSHLFLFFYHSSTFMWNIRKRLPLNLSCIAASSSFYWCSIFFIFSHRYSCVDGPNQFLFIAHLWI